MTERGSVFAGPPHCWCISKGMAGMNSQTSGLAEAVGVRGGDGGCGRRADSQLVGGSGECRSHGAPEVSALAGSGDHFWPEGVPL